MRRLFVFFFAIAACGVDGKAEYAQEQREKRRACLGRICDEGQICNEGFPGGRCQAPQSQGVGAPCGGDDNCASGACQNVSGVPFRCSAR